MEERDYFRVCSTCKSPIQFGEQYYSCSVSTCNKKTTAMFFCSVPCWDAHLPVARHRDAWAEVEKAPSREEWQKEQASTGEEKTRRRVVSSAASRTGNAPGSESAGSANEQDLVQDNLPKDVLVVMSKLKNYIKARSGLNTSDGVSDPLSEQLRKMCDAAIRSARANGRKTVLARDIEAGLHGGTAQD